jgi:Zn-dependent peptidase ImmA (M78 family)
METWGAIRAKARDHRTSLALDQGQTIGRASDIATTAAAEAALAIIPVPSDDPLLGGAHAALHANVGVIAISAELDEERRWFAVAHELGHKALHGENFHCGEDDVQESPQTMRLPFGEGRIDTYNPRQRRELEASVYAAEFLMPGSLLRERFVGGDRLTALKQLFAVSETALLHQLSTVLLTPMTASTAPATAPTTESMALDPSQRQAAEAPTGPLLIEAGPGTGKTRTLVGRVLHLRNARKVLPERILALTFSNKAAQEMRERLAAADPRYAHAITVSTFHGFGYELLKQHGHHIGQPKGLRVLDPVDAALMLERQLPELRLVEYANLYEPGFYLEAILRTISQAKDLLISPESYAEAAARMATGARTDEEVRSASKAVEAARVYRLYEVMLLKSGQVDYGDLILKSVQLLETHAAVRLKLQGAYEHILVDEYQDVNRASA